MNIKYVVSFAAGVAVGVASTVMFLKKKYQDRLEEDLRNEQLFWREHVRKIKQERAQYRGEERDILAEKEKHYEELAQKTIDKINEDIRNNVSENERELYFKAYRDIVERCLYGLPEEEINNRIRKTKETEPIEIDEDTYGGDDYECLCLTWYRNQVLVSDLNGVYIPDREAEELIGTIGIRRLTEDDADLVYIRNEALGIDIEIAQDRNHEWDIEEGGYDE